MASDNVVLMPDIYAEDVTVDEAAVEVTNCYDTR